MKARRLIQVALIPVGVIARLGARFAGAVKGIAKDPLSGEPKTGALKGVRVVKFKVSQQQLLLAYQFDSRRNIVQMLDVGPHENFYRELQKYLGAR